VDVPKLIAQWQVAVGFCKKRRQHANRRYDNGNRRIKHELCLSVPSLRFYI